MYVIYIDVLFMINLIMDTLIFFCTTLILNRKVKLRKIVMAALMASLFYCMLVVLPILQSIPYSIYAFFIPVPAILYLYKPQRVKEFAKLYLLSLFIAAVYGGIIFNVWYTLGSTLYQNKSIGIYLLVFIAVMVTTCFYFAFYFIRRRLIFPAFEYQLALKDHDRYVEVRALLDTGNLLYTPIGHEPVIVVEYGAIKPLLSDEEQSNYETFYRSSTKEIEDSIIKGKCKAQALIPFSSVGCNEGYLWGIRVDEMIIKKVSGERKVSDCMVGISRETLFSDKQYQALLHPEFIFEEAMVS